MAGRAVQAARLFSHTQASPLPVSCPAQSRQCGPSHAAPQRGRRCRRRCRQHSLEHKLEGGWMDGWEGESVGERMHCWQEWLWLLSREPRSNLPSAGNAGATRCMPPALPNSEAHQLAAAARQDLRVADVGGVELEEGGLGHRKRQQLVQQPLGDERRTSRRGVQRGGGITRWRRHLGGSSTQANRISQPGSGAR